MKHLNEDQKQLLFDYCTGLTSEQETAKAEQLISSNAEAAELHSKLKTLFTPLDSMQDEQCPDDLVESTILRLNNAARSSQLHLQQLLETEQTKKATTKSWFWGDAIKRLATAAIFMVVGGITISTYNAGTSYARHNSLKQRCQMQLSRIGRGISNYQGDHNGQMPSVAMAAGAPWWKIGDKGTENNSNTRHMWRMVKEGYAEPEDFVCPGRINGRKIVYKIPHIERLNDFPDRRLVTYSLRIMCEKSKNGMIKGSRALIADLNPLFEILPHQYDKQLNLKLNKVLLKLNSINHQRRGQNILFCDGSSRFAKKRRIGVLKDDIFTLKDTQVYKGTEIPSCETDAFLAP